MHPILSVARAPPAPVADNSNVIRLEGRVKRWRTIASAVGALAAALLVTLSLQIFQPDALPGGLRPAPRIQTVEVKTPAAPLTAAAQYVALLQGQGGGPAFILTVDGATRNFTVRKVGATPEAGKSFELWLISDKLPRPRSLGVIGAGDFTARPVLGSLRSRGRQRCDLRRHRRAGRRLAQRPADLGSGVFRQADRDRAAVSAAGAREEVGVVAP